MLISVDDEIKQEMVSRKSSLGAMSSHLRGCSVKDSSQKYRTTEFNNFSTNIYILW